jgi:hypothetical protein
MIMIFREYQRKPTGDYKSLVSNSPRSEANPLTKSSPEREVPKWSGFPNRECYELWAEGNKETAAELFLIKFWPLGLLGIKASFALRIAGHNPKYGARGWLG